MSPRGTDRPTRYGRRPRSARCVLSVCCCLCCCECGVVRYGPTKRQRAEPRSMSSQRESAPFSQEVISERPGDTKSTTQFAPKFLPEYSNAPRQGNQPLASRAPAPTAETAAPMDVLDCCALVNCCCLFYSCASHRTHLHSPATQHFANHLTQVLESPRAGRPDSLRCRRSAGLASSNNRVGWGAHCCVCCLDVPPAPDTHTA